MAGHRTDYEFIRKYVLLLNEFAKMPNLNQEHKVNTINHRRVELSNFHLNN